MTPGVRGWWRRLAERRRFKHELPIPADEMAQLRRKGWRLVQMSQRAKGSAS